MTYQSKASDGSKGPRLEVETLKVTKGGKPPGAPLRSGKSATENTAKLSTAGWQRGESNACPSSHLLEQLDLGDLCWRDHRAIECSLSAGGKTADPLLLASQRCKLKTSIKGFLRNRQTLFQSSCKTALENYLIVSYKM